MLRTKFVGALNSILKRLKHSEQKEYQYIQRSKIPTMHFQPSLPRLPIPELGLTCARYLAAQRPLLVEEAYRKIEASVAHFRENVGESLQNYLVAKDKRMKHTSYISEIWFHMYLSDRKPLPINYNPALIFHNDKRSEYNTQLLKTANMLISSLRFYKSLKAGILEPEVYHLNAKKSDNDTFRTICSLIPASYAWYAAYLLKAYPLDMSQYHNLFNTTRIPETGKDRISHDPVSKHIIVQSNGHFYTFNVFDESGNILPAEKILASLQFICNDKIAAAKYPVGALTTLNRDKWADLRHRLSALGNEKELKAIDSALFNICLDEQSVATDTTALCRHFLHGNGINRWFDKSFSLIVSKDGIAGVNFEHSWGDGVAVLRYFQDIHRDSMKNPQIHPNTEPHNDGVNNIHRLDIKLDAALKSAVTEALTSYKDTCDKLAVNTLEFEGLGKNLCKKHEISPDAVMQLGFQDAYYKKSGKCVASYESCSTAAFKHGRTETIRPCTMATRLYCESVNKASKLSNAEVKKLIAECSKIHNKLTRDAAMGQGFDRHLYALRKVAEEINLPTPIIYSDHAFEAINHNIISTSTLSSPSVWAGGFGPVVQDGLGLAYYIKDDALGVLVTSYPPHCNGGEYVECLKSAYGEIMAILKAKL